MQILSVRLHSSWTCYELSQVVNLGFMSDSAALLQKQGHRTKERHLHCLPSFFFISLVALSQRETFSNYLTRCPDTLRREHVLSLHQH